MAEVGGVGRSGEVARSQEGKGAQKKRDATITLLAVAVIFGAMIVVSQYAPGAHHHVLQGMHGHEGKMLGASATPTTFKASHLGIEVVGGVIGGFVTVVGYKAMKGKRGDTLQDVLADVKQALQGDTLDPEVAKPLQQRLRACGELQLAAELERVAGMELAQDDFLPHFRQQISARLEASR